MVRQRGCDTRTLCSHTMLVPRHQQLIADATLYPRHGIAQDPGTTLRDASTKGFANGTGLCGTIHTYLSIYVIDARRHGRTWNMKAVDPLRQLLADCFRATVEIPHTPITLPRRVSLLSLPVVFNFPPTREDDNLHTTTLGCTFL